MTGEFKLADDFGSDAWFERKYGRPRKTSTDLQPVGFLSKEQRAEANAWVNQHIIDKHKGKFPYAGAAGGALGWKIIDTGIGQCVSIFCMCGDEHDVTNFDDW